MVSIASIADSKGRINYEQLKDFVSKLSLAEFEDQAKQPFLVGKELYDGEIMSRPSTSVSTSTMRFRSSDFRANGELSDISRSRFNKPSDTNPMTRLPLDSMTGTQAIDRFAGLSNAIFLIKRKLYSTEPENTVSIGRAATNDIVVADYVISKSHAQIINFKGMHFIVDLGSTNGTKVNHQSIPSGSKIQLQYNDMVSFGRFVFVFTNPMSVYSGLRKELLGIA